jgi:hypothetical protein
MRIAYISPYQGPTLLRCRPTIQNLSLAGNVKIELISELLHRAKHEVEVFSQGEVVDHRARLYRGMSESKRFHVKIPVSYASALPIKFVNGIWSSWRLRELFKQRHRISPFDLVIIYNLKAPQVACAEDALRLFGLPVILEYEDAAFVDLGGRVESGLRSRWSLSTTDKIVRKVSGCIGVSPLLLSRVPASTPKLLLRGVVGKETLLAGKQPMRSRNHWCVYSGTLVRGKGLEALVAAWKLVDLPGWELHIAGDGALRDELAKHAEGDRRIVFHGILNRQDNARFLATARIGLNPHDLSQTPGNVFAFKIIEYLAAGLHCVTTPMGSLEPELETGITYMPDNSPATIAATIMQVIQNCAYERVASGAAQDAYGPDAVERALDTFLRTVTNGVPRT